MYHVVGISYTTDNGSTYCEHVLADVVRYDEALAVVASERGKYHHIRVKKEQA